jgi:hypothetical protein
VDSATELPLTSANSTAAVDIATSLAVYSGLVKFTTKKIFQQIIMYQQKSQQRPGSLRHCCHPNYSLHHCFHTLQVTSHTKTSKLMNCECCINTGEHCLTVDLQFAVLCFGLPFHQFIHIISLKASEQFDYINRKLTGRQREPAGFLT